MFITPIPNLARRSLVLFNDDFNALAYVLLENYKFLSNIITDQFSTFGVLERGEHLATLAKKAKYLVHMKRFVTICKLQNSSLSIEQGEKFTCICFTFFRNIPFNYYPY